MNNKSQHKNFDIYTICSQDGKTRATFVPAIGGVASSIIMPYANSERELLYQHTYFWDKEVKDLPGAWPFIFPICARIERGGVPGNYLYDGHLYNLPIHGISWWLPWNVTNFTQDTIILALSDNQETLKRYPFHFHIELKYQISDKKLACYQTYSNTGNKPMPYYAGFHPYFLTPKPGEGKEKVMLNYHAKRRFIYNDKLTDLIGEQKLLNMPISIADPKINEQLVELSEDKTSSLSFPDGFQLSMKAEGTEDPNMFKYVQVYTQPHKPFVCIEPWMGFPNAMNTVAGCRFLKPNESEHGIIQLWT